MRIPAVSTMIATPQLPTQEWIQRSAARNPTDRKPKMPNETRLLEPPPVPHQGAVLLGPGVERPPHHAL